MKYRATFIRPDGTRQTLEVREGSSLMRAAIDQGIDEIVGECGGHLACGTCHVYVDPAWAEACPPIAQGEEDMLEMTSAPRRPLSRLCCQLPLSAALDGIVVEIADPQL